MLRNKTTIEHTDELLNEMLVEEDGEMLFRLTDYVETAIYIFEDGRMLDGAFDYGIRSNDHRCIEYGMEIDRYTKGFWDVVHERYNVVRLVPESRVALVKEWQELSPIQLELIEEGGYTIEMY